MTPAPLGKGSKIAITAVSAGISECHQARFDAIVLTLQARGYQVVIGDCLKGGVNNASAPRQQRADELMAFLTDPSIDAIAPPWGGELAIELLPLLDFEAIAHSKPKWLFGFSDVSTLAVALFGKVGWTTVHASNLMDLIADSPEPLIANTLMHLEQAPEQAIKQTASQQHSRNWPAIDKDPKAVLIGDRQTQWQWLVKPPNDDVMRGHLVGGCWDTLVHLFATPYLDLKTLKARYPKGLILYLENAEMSPCALTRAIHSMVFRGVFEVVDGLVLGRNYVLDSDDTNQLSYLDVLTEHLADKQVPVLYDVDIGHVPPNLILFNGYFAEFKLIDGQGSVTQWSTTDAWQLSQL